MRETTAVSVSEAKISGVVNSIWWPEMSVATAWNRKSWGEPPVWIQNEKLVLPMMGSG